MKMEKSKYKDFKRETIRKKSINLKIALEVLNDDQKKKKKPKPIDKFAKQRAEMFGINTRKIRSPFDKFSFFKEDVDKSLNDLEYAIEERINKRYLKPLKSNRVILPKINLTKSQNIPEKITEIVENPKSNNSDTDNREKGNNTIIDNENSN